MRLAVRAFALTLGIAVSLIGIVIFAQDDDPPLTVMKIGLGSGTVTGTGINCGNDCDEGFASMTSVTLTAAPAGDSTFVGWGGACSGTGTCTVIMSVARAVTANFRLTAAITTISDFAPDGPTGLQQYLMDHPEINTPARFVAALPVEFRQNWILMSRSESLQTGTARTPRILMPSVDARFVFTIGMTPHSSYPGAHPNAIEFMQWDATQKNFRFHEVIVADIPAMPAPSTIPARSRGVSIDDDKCSRCHSTKNVLNHTTSNGTSGPPGNVKFKNKPNWDSYDSWGGMTPFNRDRIYQGSVEAAAFRHIFNLWNWRNSAENDSIRQILEQLVLQPPQVPSGGPHGINRVMDATTDTAHVVFGFDALGTIAPTTRTSDYDFDGTTGATSTVTQGGRYVTLRPSAPPTSTANDNYTSPGSDEGRGVQLFDRLGGGDGNLNPQRIADELLDHRFATGSAAIDIRPITLAVAKGCLSINTAGNGSITSSPALTVDFSFFNARNGVAGINELVSNTRTRAQGLPQRKADIQKLDLDRTGDPYVMTPTTVNGLIAEYGAGTTAGTSTAISRIRNEVFQRPIETIGFPSATMGGIYTDRELYSSNTNTVALFRYFLEPLGVSVDKWSMGVRGRSRTYTFADVFGTYLNEIQSQMAASLGLTSPNCATVIGLVNSSLGPGKLPGVADVPKYTDVQRIFNKSCIECHGDLHYPPYQNFGTTLNLAEEEHPAAGVSPMRRPYSIAQPRSMSLTGPIFRFITKTDERCPPAGLGMMPCGGPPLSKADIETIRRWIVGGAMYTEGDPHIRTIDGVDYDFQSAGEFVLLRDVDLEVQARQTAVETGEPLPPNGHTGLSSCVSINTAAAVRVGPHRVTYEPDLNGKQDDRGLQLRIDGKLAELPPGSEIRLAAGGRVFRAAVGDNIQVDSPGGTVIVITSNFWTHRQLWYININVRQSRATDGVMGVIAPDNWLPALPDGTFLGPRPIDLHERYVQLYEKFEEAWRVTNATSLFDYAPGTSTDTFTIEEWPIENAKKCVLPIPSTIPPQEPIDEQTAQQICGQIRDKVRWHNCVQDVMVTGEPGFAKAYVETETAERNEFPRPPTLGLPEDRADVESEKVAFTFGQSEDPEKARVTYRHCLWPVDKQFTLNDCDPKPLSLESNKEGMFLRTVATTPSGEPLRSGGSYFWKVIAEDEKGGLTESETRRFVVK